MKTLKESMVGLMSRKHFRILEELTPEQYADTIELARKLSHQDHRMCHKCRTEVEILGHEWHDDEGLIHFEREPVEMDRVFDNTRNDSRWVNHRDLGAQTRNRPSTPGKMGMEKKGKEYHVLVFEYYCPTCDEALTKGMTGAIA